MEQLKESTEMISAFLLYVVVLQPYMKLRNEPLPPGSLSELLEYYMALFQIFWSNSTLNFIHNFNLKVLSNLCEMRAIGSLCKKYKNL